MKTTGWHATDDQLTAFARAPRTLDDTTAASVEAHLAACAQCRFVVAGAADATATAASWTAIADRIDRPKRSMIERLLARVLSDSTARLVAATPTLRLAWVAAVVAVAAAAVAATHNLNTDAPFLAIAPFVPLAGVALAFGPFPDPAGETALATPAHGAGLVIARTMAVLASSVPILLASSAFLPVVEARAVAWLLPALALTALATALSTWLTPYVAATSAATAWAVAIVLVTAVEPAHRNVADSNLFGPYAQLLFALLLAAATLVTAARRQHFTTLEVR